MATRAKNNVVDLKSHQQEARQRETREQVLERLFNEHAGALRGFLRMRLGVGDDMEDIVQDVFIRLAKIDNLIERFPPKGASNRSFIFAVANNLVVDIERHKRIQQRYAEQQWIESQDIDMASPPTPEAITLADQQLLQLKAQIMKLKPTWRQAFILNRIQRLSYKETALEMDVTVKQVERFLKSAITRLREAAIEITEENGAGGQYR